MSSNSLIEFLASALEESLQREQAYREALERVDQVCAEACAQGYEGSWLDVVVQAGSIAEGVLVEHGKPA